MNARKIWPDDFGSAENHKGIRCFKCGCSHFEVLNTRKTTGNAIWRRRRCKHCGQIKTTYEK
jgi:uncharacterized Zn finger protein